MKSLSFLMCIIFAPSIFLAQIDEYYSYDLPSNEDSYPITIREMEEGKAVIFNIENYFSVPPSNIKSYLTKVNFEGDSEIFTSIKLDLYENIMIFDGYYNNNNYIFLGLAYNIIENKNYFITLFSDIDLSTFSIIDKIEVEYPFFSSLDYSIQYDSLKNIYYFPFSIGNRNLISLQDLFFVIDSKGQVVEYTVLNLRRTNIQDYHYSSDNEKHYITSSDNFTVLNSELDVVHSSNLQFYYNNEYIFLNQFRILHVESNNVTFIGRNNSNRKLYILNIEYYDNAGFKVLSFKEFNNSIGGHFLLRKVIGPDNKVFISSTIDALDTPDQVPNINYIWEINKSKNVEKTYELNHSFKTNIGLRDVGINNEMIGLGVEIVTNRKFYFVLNENNRFLVSTDEISSESAYKIKIYPNPTSQYITIETEIDENLSYSIYNINGIRIKTGDLYQHNTIEMESFTSGSYMIEFYNTRNKKVSVHKIIVAK